jgi:hypothetical protein
MVLPRRKFLAGGVFLLVFDTIQHEIRNVSKV